MYFYTIHFSNCNIRIENLDFKFSNTKAWPLLKKLDPNSHKNKNKPSYINLMSYQIV